MSGRTGHVWRVLIGGQLRFGLLTWLVFAVVFTAIGVGIGLFGQLDQSTWQYAMDAGVRYVPLLIGMQMAPHLAVFVAHGVTRREFTRAACGCVPVAGLFFGVAQTVGYQVERGLYALYDVPDRLSGPHLFSSTGQVGLVLLESALVATAYVTSGWVIGAGFTRFRMWPAVWLVIPGALPALAAEALLRTGWVTEVLPGLGRLPLTVVVPAGVVVIALGLLAGRLMLRRSAVGDHRVGGLGYGRGPIHAITGF